MNPSKMSQAIGSDPTVNFKPRVEDQKVMTDILIVGAGPAGASLASFMASYGLTGIMLGLASGTADTPRAHITNMAALGQ